MRGCTAPTRHAPRVGGKRHAAVVCHHAELALARQEERIKRQGNLCVDECLAQLGIVSSHILLGKVQKRRTRCPGLLSVRLKKVAQIGDHGLHVVQGVRGLDLLLHEGPVHQYTLLLRGLPKAKVTFPPDRVAQTRESPRKGSGPMLAGSSPRLSACVKLVFEAIEDLRRVAVAELSDHDLCFMDKIGRLGRAREVRRARQSKQVAISARQFEGGVRVQKTTKQRSVR